MSTTRRSLLSGSAVLAASMILPRPASAAGTAVVLLHGKQSSVSALSPVASALSSVGVSSSGPDLPWSSWRYLSGNWEQAMGEIDTAVKQAKASGAAKIVLLGHSMGCPAAMSYAAQRGGVAGLVLAAPGHTPFGYFNFDPQMRQSIETAQAMVKAGKGSETGSFSDSNQGRTIAVSMPAADYLSYFDPKGPAEMRNTAGRVRVPAMWVVGTQDRVMQWGQGIGRQLAGRPKGKYLVVEADHRSTPGVAAQEIAAWVAAL